MLKEWSVNLNDSMPHIYDGMYGIQLSKLKKLWIACNPPTLESCVIPMLPNLESLSIIHASFKEIFLFEEHGCEVELAGPPIHLSNLTLFRLPELLHLSKENSQPNQVFQTLTTLTVEMCGGLKNLVPSSVSFQNLMTLEVSDCDGLIHFVTLPTAKSLAQLTRMSITACETIEEIVAHAGDEEMDQIVFNKLEYLKLDGLPILTSFCSGNYSFKFPSLKQAIVKDCPNLKTFCQGELSTAKLRYLQLTEKEDEGCWEGDLNSTVRHVYEEMFGFRGFAIVCLSDFPQLKEKWHCLSIVSFFCDLESLVVDECGNIKSAIPANLLPFLKSLQELGIKDCDSLEDVFELEPLNVDGHFGLLSELTELRLVNLPRLRNIWNKNHLEILGFGNLKSLVVHKCASLRHIFTPSTILSLVQLQDLEITECDTVEEIITREMEEETATNNTLKCESLRCIVIKDCPQLKAFAYKALGTSSSPLFDEKIAFPSLEVLKLSKLPKLVQLWNESCKAYQNLATVEISECGSLKSLFPSSASLQVLTTLELSKCDGLTNLVSFPTAKSLEQLTKINITDCKMMEEIVARMGDEENDQVVFRKLEYLGLHCLPSITGFYLGNYAMGFPSLEQVVLRQCPRINTFSRGAISTSKLQRVKITESEDEFRWEGDLNTTIQKLSEELDAQRREED